MQAPNNIIGLLGGTFDPFHNGHLSIALQLLKKIHFDRIEFIPCKKPAIQKQPTATAKQRLQMTQLGTAQQEKLSVNPVEMQRAGASYMIDTLRVLRSHHSHDSLCLIMGADTLQYLNQWLHWYQLLELAHIVVVSRPQHPLTMVAWLKTLLQQHQSYNVESLYTSYNGSIYFEELNTPNISSTEIRCNLKAKKSVEAFLPHSVLEYIQQQQLYR